MECDYSVKIVIVGEGDVGKSSLLLRYVDGNYGGSLNTVGVDSKFKFTTCSGKKLRLQLWDTAGQERFRTITTGFYRNSHGVLLCYDISNPETFNTLEQWLQEVKRNLNLENVPIVICGLKSDLSPDRVVDEAAAKAKATEWGHKYIEVSSKDNVNVKEAFDLLCSEIVNAPWIETTRPASQRAVEPKRSNPSSAGGKDRSCCGGGGGSSNAMG